MALKLILKQEIILPESYFSKEDFDDFQGEDSKFDDLINFLEEDMMSLFNFTNGLKAFIHGYEWCENEPIHKNAFLENYLTDEEIN